MTQNWAESLSWRSVQRILSLDLSRAIYQELGTGIRCEETLRGLARDALTGRLGAEFLTRDLARDAGPDFYWEQAVPFQEGIERALGRSARASLEHWARYVASTEANNPWTNYEDLFLSWASTFRRTGKDEIGFAIDASLVASELRSRTDLSDVEEILNRERRKPITDWDAACFERLEVYGHPGETDYLPYLAEIKLAIAMKRFQDFWRWLLSAIGPLDLQAIASAAQKRLASHEGAFSAPDQLPFPPIA